MRVIGGTARGRKLVGPSSEGTRPLSDRARESLFNILGPGIRGERVLDLFAGTGAVGLEALSRGAASATFVEQGRAALHDIRANLDSLAFAEQATVVAGDALGFLVRARDQYDVIFAGPPQWAELWSKTLVAIDQRDEVLAEGGLVITQLDPTEDTGDPDLSVLTRVDQRTYGRTLLLLHERRPA
jgi:16S rRNA (guanine966-N2)-methyltransferase